MIWMGVDHSEQIRSCISQAVAVHGRGADAGRLSDIVTAAQAFGNLRLACLEDLNDLDQVISRSRAGEKVRLYGFTVEWIT